MSNRSVNCCETTGSPGRHLTQFSRHDVSNTTTLLLSEDEKTLYVGARDAVLALDVGQKDTITLRSKVRKPTVTTDGVATYVRRIISTEGKTGI